MRRPSLLVRGSHDEIEILPLTYIGDLPETSNLSKRCRPASYWFYILPDPLLLQPRGAIGDRSGRVAKAQEGATMNGVSQANCSLCSTANPQGARFCVMCGHALGAGSRLTMRAFAANLAPWKRFESPNAARSTLARAQIVGFAALGLLFLTAVSAQTPPPEIGLPLTAAFVGAAFLAGRGARSGSLPLHAGGQALGLAVLGWEVWVHAHTASGLDLAGLFAIDDIVAILLIAPLRAHAALRRWSVPLRVTGTST
jgi:hypothetical protein